jgi:translation initiation factor 2 beta subunit (eIF-2beta)/eIF-5
MTKILEEARAELAAMKTSGASRVELSLHACKRLFFDHGIRPTVTNVRDLTLTGSASDIPRDIDAFWERVRQVSQVRVGVGRLPESLELAAGDLLTSLYQSAVHLARDEFQAEREAMQLTVQAAEQARLSAEAKARTAEGLAERAVDKAGELMHRRLSQHAEMGTQAEAARVELAYLQSTVAQLKDEKNELLKRMAGKEAELTQAREAIGRLQDDLQSNAEHYAEQIKDAMAEAERRIRPLLIELDGLRQVAANYQDSVKTAATREFDYIQQLSVAKGRNDTLTTQVDRMSGELGELHRELGVARRQGAMPEAVGKLLATLVTSGRLAGAELDAVASSAGSFLQNPARCPACGEGEPELIEAGGEFEFSCDECGHQSGLAPSRVHALAAFLRTSG